MLLLIKNLQFFFYKTRPNCVQIYQQLSVSGDFLPKTTQGRSPWPRTSENKNVQNRKNDLDKNRLLAGLLVV